MDLQNALECGELTNILIQMGYKTSMTAASDIPVEYALEAYKHNLTGGVASDVGVKLTNGRREQTWTVETHELATGTVGLNTYWAGTVDGSPKVEEVLGITPTSSTEGYTMSFGGKARIQNGTYIDRVDMTEVDNVSTLTMQESLSALHTLTPKVFNELNTPDSTVAGILHEDASSLLKQAGVEGLRGNSVAAILVQALKSVLVEVAELRAKKVTEKTYIKEEILVLMGRIQLEPDGLNLTESVSYTLD